LTRIIPAATAAKPTRLPAARRSMRRSSRYTVTPTTVKIVAIARSVARLTGARVGPAATFCAVFAA